MNHPYPINTLVKLLKDATDGDTGHERITPAGSFGQIVTATQYERQGLTYGVVVNGTGALLFYAEGHGDFAEIEPAVQPPKVVTIYGNEYVPQVGSYILVGDNAIGDKLLPGDAPVDSGYRGSQFRLPVQGPGPIRSVACNVEITGRTKQRRNGSLYVRVWITWVGDCEPDTTSGGWMLVG